MHVLGQEWDGLTWYREPLTHGAEINPARMSLQKGGPVIFCFSSWRPEKHPGNFIDTVQERALALFPVLTLGGFWRPGPGYRVEGPLKHVGG